MVITSQYLPEISGYVENVVFVQMYIILVVLYNICSYPNPLRDKLLRNL